MPAASWSCTPSWRSRLRAVAPRRASRSTRPSESTPVTPKTGVPSATGSTEHAGRDLLPIPQRQSYPMAALTPPTGTDLDKSPYYTFSMRSEI